MRARGSSIIVGVCIWSFLWASACNKTETIVSGTLPTTVLMNSSFEVGGMPSLMGWSANSSDTSVVGFSKDIPPGGGQLSVRLLNAWSFAGGIRATFPAPSGIHGYRLSTWTKVVNQGFRSLGSMSIILKTPDAMLYHKRFTFSDTTWTLQSLVDTVESHLSDSIIVALSGDISQLGGGWTLFDVCVFEKLD